MIAPARRAAFGALLAVVRDGRDSASALAHARGSLSDPRDLALAVELVTGTLRWQGAIDAALAPFLPRGLARLDVGVLVALRLGAYQRLFLDRIPAAAAVNDSVSLVRAHSLASAAGLVNAVLRQTTPHAARLHWPEAPLAVGSGDEATREQALAFLSTTLSHPRWLMTRWLDRYGLASAQAWARFDNAPAPLTLRPVHWRGSRADLAASLATHGVVTQPTRFAPDGLIVTDGQPFQTPLASEGVFVAQDEASQLVAVLAAALAAGPVLDACASPGGKTTLLRGALGPDPLIVACDLRPRRVELLRATLRATAAPRVPVVRCDTREPLPFSASFGLVLLDAPCSGLGTIRREPEVRWRRTADDLPALAADQLRMLTETARTVRPGGVLVYATCSSEPEENEQVVDAFLATHPSFARLVRADHPWQGGPLEDLLDQRGDLRTEPHRHGLEAFYAAVLQQAETPGRPGPTRVNIGERRGL